MINGQHYQEKMIVIVFAKTIMNEAIKCQLRRDSNKCKCNKIIETLHK